MKTLLGVVAGITLLAVAGHAQIVRSGTLRATDRTLVRALAGAQAEHWKLDARAPSGAVTRLIGSLALDGATDDERCVDLLAKVGPLFDITPAIDLDAPRLLHVSRSTGSRVLRMRQLSHGMAVNGHGLTVEIDRDGAATCVHGIVSLPAALLPAPVLTPAQAIAIADAHLAGQALAGAGWRNGPHLIGGYVDVIGRAGRPFWRIGAVTAGLLPLAVDVDALNGSVLAQFENTTSFGEGTFKFMGSSDAFKTGNGKGVVFKDFKNAAAGKSAQQSLPELALQTTVPVLAEDNTLFGRFSLVLNFFDGMSLSTIPGAAHKFLGFPSDVIVNDADLFDATNCYFHIAKYALAMTKLAGQPLPTDFSMPTIVNTPAVPFNAFFSSDDFGLGTGPGFMIYGDNSFFTGALADDFTRDPTVMCHEYTHAIVNLSGIDFSVDGLNTPGRGVNEALADYFAGSFFKDPRIGFPLAQHASNELIDTLGLTLTGGLRNLLAPKTVLDDLFEVVDKDGFPEEHAGGHIFGATLWHIREIVKQKVTDDLVFDSMFNWPESLTELGYMTYSPANAGQAWVDFYGECLLQLVDDTFAKKGKSTALKVIGAAMQNGALGVAEFGNGVILDASQGGSFTIGSSFLGTSDGHVIGLALNSGQTFDITLTGDKKSATKVDLAFSEPSMNALSLPNTPSVSDTKITVKGAVVNQGGIFGIFPLNDGIKGFTPRKYTIKITVKK